MKNVQRHSDNRSFGFSGRSHHLALSMGLRTVLAILTVVIGFSLLPAPASAHDFTPAPPLLDEPHSHTVPICPVGFDISVEPATGNVSCVGPYDNGYTNICMTGVLIDESTCQYQTGTTSTTADVWIVDAAAYSYEEDQGFYVTDIQNQCTDSVEQQYEEQCCLSYYTDWGCIAVHGYADYCYICDQYQGCGALIDVTVTTCADVPVQVWVPDMVTVYVDEVGHWESQTVTVPVYATEASFLGCLDGWNDTGSGCVNPYGTTVSPTGWQCPSGWLPDGPLAPEAFTDATLCWFSANSAELYKELLEGGLPNSFEDTLDTSLFAVPDEYATDALYELSASRFGSRVLLCREADDSTSENDRSWSQRFMNVVGNPLTGTAELFNTLIDVNPITFVTDYATCFFTVLLIPSQDSMTIILSGKLQASGTFPTSFAQCSHAPGSEQNSCITRGFLSAPIHTLNKAASGQLDCKGPNLPIASIISTATSNLPTDNPLASQDLVGSMDDEDFYPASGCADTHIASLGSYVRDPLSWLLAFWCIWTLMKVGRRAVVGG